MYTFSLCTCFNIYFAGRVERVPLLGWFGNGSDYRARTAIQSNGDGMGDYFPSRFPRQRWVKKKKTKLWNKRHMETGWYYKFPRLACFLFADRPNFWEHSTSRGLARRTVKGIRTYCLNDDQASPASKRRGSVNIIQLFLYSVVFSSFFVVSLF